MAVPYDPNEGKIPTPSQAQMDQLTTFASQNFPSLWRAMYLKLVEEGFNENQAMILLQTYILGMSGGGRI